MKPSIFGVFLLGMAAICSPSLVFAQSPQGGTVAAGAATISQNGASTVINQTSNRAVIDWRSFSVGKDASVDIRQPGASSTSLQRITGSDPSTIAGRLTSNGNVVISNPNGVLFQNGSQVNLGGLIATTGRVDADRLMRSGEVAISGTSRAPIYNDSVIKSAGPVSFVGRDVQVGSDGGVQAGSAVNLIGAGGAAVTDGGTVLTVDAATAGKIAALGVLSGSRILISAPGGSAEISSAALPGARSTLIGRPGPDAHEGGYVVGQDGQYAGVWQATARSLSIGGQVVLVAPASSAAEASAPAVVAAPVSAPVASSSPFASVAVPGREAELAGLISSIMASYSATSSPYKRSAEDR